MDDYDYDYEPPRKRPPLATHRSRRAATITDLRRRIRRLERTIQALAGPIVAEGHIEVGPRISTHIPTHSYELEDGRRELVVAGPPQTTISVLCVGDVFASQAPVSGPWLIQIRQAPKD